MKGKFDDWALAAICQDVCPWNKFSKDIMNRYLMRLLAYCQCPKDWDEITEETFKTVFKNSL
jgi:epoxyqueuosine reductase